MQHVQQIAIAAQHHQRLGLLGLAPSRGPGERGGSFLRAGVVGGEQGKAQRSWSLRRTDMAALTLWQRLWRMGLTMSEPASPSEIDAQRDALTGLPGMAAVRARLR